MHVLTNITHFVSKEPVFEFPKDPILVLVQNMHGLEKMSKLQRTENMDSDLQERL